MKKQLFFILTLLISQKISAAAPLPDAPLSSPLEMIDNLSPKDFRQDGRICKSPTHTPSFSPVSQNPTETPVNNHRRVSVFEIYSFYLSNTGQPYPDDFFSRKKNPELVKIVVPEIPPKKIQPGLRCCC